MKPKNSRKLISIVVPVQNEEGNVGILSESIIKNIPKEYSYEILFIDDGSTDSTLVAIKALNKKSSKIKYASFSRNFGHQNALRAGLDLAKGDCVVTMDGDMQHPPKVIPKLIKEWERGSDIVYTVRKENKKVSFLKRKTAAMFYGIVNRLASINIEKGAADFRLLDRSVVDIVKTIREHDLFIRGMISWLGYRQARVEYFPSARHSGETKYSLKKMTKLALSGITGFSVTPLHLSTFIGFVISGLSFLYGVYALYLKIFTDKVVSGWTSLLVVVLFMGGMQLIMLGILGEYIGKIFMESKKRPSYIIKEKSND